MTPNREAIEAWRMLLQAWRNQMFGAQFTATLAAVRDDINQILDTDEDEDEDEDQ